MRVCIGLTLGIGFVLTAHPALADMRITFIDAGQADVAVIQIDQVSGEQFTILVDGGNGDSESPQEELERLRTEVASLKASQKKGVRLQVSAKGGVSLYGIRRFPVTFYLEEWERILGMADEIRAFMAENKANLKRKGEG